MLLSVEPFDDSVEGTLLDLWYVGGKHQVVRPPCQPHYFSFQEQGDSVTVKKSLLSSPSKVRLVDRVDFPNLRSLDRFRLPDALESHKRFVDVLVCDFGFSVPSQEPSVLAWDIETFTFAKTGVDWRRDTIKSIAVWGGLVSKSLKKSLLVESQGTYKELFVKPDGSVRICWRVDDGHDEISVIKSFIRFVGKHDPDVLAGYNDGDYDMRVLLTRCRRHRLRCPLGRDGSEPYIIVRDYERRGKHREAITVRIAGRVHLDVLKEVFLDQTLYDLKGRGQLEVAKHFGFSPIEGVNHANIPDERLAEINIDDARCCYGLAQLYLKNIYALCEELAVPLNLMAERSPSHVPNWFYGQAFSKLGIISDGYNKDRFAKIFNRGGKPYQGAFVKCFRTGLFFNVEHIDYASFYPSIMMKYNLSPETVSLVAIKPYTGQYRFEEYDDYMILEVPDIPKKKGKPDMERAAQFVCRIDMSKDSVTQEKLVWIRDERARLKKLYKKTKDEKLMSRQYALKVVQNTLYGYNAMRYALYGNILVAILITALARYHIKKKIVELEQKGKKIIEVDTDGLYCV